jgi:hypothetical protein
MSRNPCKYNLFYKPQKEVYHSLCRLGLNIEIYFSPNVPIWERIFPQAWNCAPQSSVAIQNSNSNVSISPSVCTSQSYIKHCDYLIYTVLYVKLRGNYLHLSVGYSTEGTRISSQRTARFQFTLNV